VVHSFPRQKRLRLSLQVDECAKPLATGKALAQEEALRNAGNGSGAHTKAKLRLFGAKEAGPSGYQTPWGAIGCL
jgi:hypothetical protein